MRVWENCGGCPFHVFPSEHPGYTGASGWATKHRCSYHKAVITDLKKCEFAKAVDLATEKWKEIKAKAGGGRTR